MKLLVLCDDLWHPGEAVRRGLSFLADRGDELDVIMDPKDIVTHEMLREYDAVIVAKGNALNGANHTAPWFEDGITWVKPEDYEAYVAEGGAYLALHAGLTFGPDCPGMMHLNACHMHGHPPQCPVHLHVTNLEHPIMQGVSDFTFPQDEHYQIELLTDDMTVLFETSSRAGGRYPAGYTREIGKGRFCALTPGHNAFAINVPEYQKILCNTLDWLTKKI